MMWSQGHRTYKQHFAVWWSATAGYWLAGDMQAGFQPPRIFSWVSLPDTEALQQVLLLSSWLRGRNNLLERTLFYFGGISKIPPTYSWEPEHPFEFRAWAEYERNSAGFKCDFSEFKSHHCQVLTVSLWVHHFYTLASTASAEKGHTVAWGIKLGSKSWVHCLAARRCPFSAGPSSLLLHPSLQIASGAHKWLGLDWDPCAYVSRICWYSKLGQPRVSFERLPLLVPGYKMLMKGGHQSGDGDKAPIPICPSLCFRLVWKQLFHYSSAAWSDTWTHAHQETLCQERAPAFPLYFLTFM